MKREKEFFFFKYGGIAGYVSSDSRGKAHHRGRDDEAEAGGRAPERNYEVRILGTDIFVVVE